MTEYIIRRLLALIPVLLGASAIVFFSLRLFAPIDIIEETLAESPGAGDPVVRARLRQEFGLDKPLIPCLMLEAQPRPGDDVVPKAGQCIWGAAWGALRGERGPEESLTGTLILEPGQYFRWVWGALRGDLGTSWSSGRPVFQQIKEALPVSLELSLLALLLAVVVSIPLGVLSAIRANTSFDYGARLVAVIGLSIPNFVIATILLLFPAMTWGWAPPLGYAPAWEDFGKHATQMFLPLLSLGAFVSATKVRLLRSSMLEVLRNDYIRTARAKGVREQLVVYRHALKNALIPTFTLFGLQVGTTLGGSVVVEQIYSLPGLGRLTLAAIQRGDFPQLQANVLYLLVIYVVVNLMTDISYAWLDPRIRYS